MRHHWIDFVFELTLISLYTITLKFGEQIQSSFADKNKPKKNKQFVVVLPLASSFWLSTPRLPTTSWRCGMGHRRTRCPWRRWAARCCPKGSTPPSTWSPSSSRRTFTSPSPASQSTSPVSASLLIMMIPSYFAQQCDFRGASFRNVPHFFHLSSVCLGFTSVLISGLCAPDAFILSGVQPEYQSCTAVLGHLQPRTTDWFKFRT